MFFHEDDICKCGNAEDCPSKGKCFRAKPGRPGSIYTVSLFYNGKEKCDYFIEKKVKWWEQI